MTDAVDQNAARPTVAIIGGGFTGAVVAKHLARARDMDGWRIVVFEPRERLGCGLAYDTAEPAHRVNVPAARMSIDPDDPDDFMHWLELRGEPCDDSEALACDGHLYPARQLFGRYVAEAIAPFLEGGRIAHHRERAVAVERHGVAWEVRGASGTRSRADVLVVATTHPAPEAPAGIGAVLSGHPRYVPDSTGPGALDRIRTGDRVLIIGTGLTSADVIATLRRRGHKGPITAFSRRGLLSRGHADRAQDPYGDFVSQPWRSAAELVAQVRRTIADAEADGFTWHAVLDALRAQGGEIWRNLPVTERRRLVRHVRPFWDVHRFRVAPQIEAVVSAGLRDGDIRVLAGSIAHLARVGENVAVSVRKRRAGGTEEWEFEAVVITTGPAHRSILQSQSWLESLGAAGYLRPDGVGLGLACSETSRALDSVGREVDNLFVAGPLARGTFGELMGLPQVNDHAIFVASQIASLARARRAAAPGAADNGAAARSA
ncbi:FAD/NAD(P)-binding protein [Sinorhizobium arboris]|uniref:FAD/NAD(P)-binding protein n=1 Tax=Sinorhizobium arboris TaxID=76745 RepID=UPI000426D97C|nr:FAD/NAD(P)-binding protein [Sinorhizobium arboris]